MFRLINGLLAAVCFVVLGSDVLAATHDLEVKRSFAAPRTDRIGLSEAISIAEGHVDGRAVSAELARFAGNDSWNVEVVSVERHLRVSINARTGVITVIEPWPQATR